MIIIIILFCKPLSCLDELFSLAFSSLFRASSILLFLKTLLLDLRKRNTKTKATGKVIKLQEIATQISSHPTTKGPH